MPENFINCINNFANNKKVRKTLLKLRAPIGLLLFVLVLTQLHRAWFWPGLAVSILGEALQVWCMSTIKTHKKLTVTGPYMVVRNPMYIGRFFLIFGILMMTGSLLSLAVFTIAYYFYMVNRVRREEKLLAEMFGEDYAEYCRDVHPYLPGFKRFDAAQIVSFNKESMAQNHVVVNFLVTVICYLVLFIFTYIQPV
ncbi:MAG: hypothetical protein COX19_05255 [Desulfobacterales bacterium CG23_combo_of_CG06-09_8_20_14_all_51_8]|nr:MAG: hypothetical protein COX19_05255 [Desulfobacterales bacterium CG23_combo_of_CG06-09_8_20_14_all_51_8]